MKIIPQMDLLMFLGKWIYRFDDTLSTNTVNQQNKICWLFLFMKGIIMEQIVYLQEYTFKPKTVPYMIPLAYDTMMKLDSKIKEANRSEKEKKNSLPIWHKYLLTIEEAAEYYGIGEKRLRRIAADNVGEDFVMEVGSQIRIKRELFEQFLNSSGTI